MCCIRCTVSRLLARLESLPSHVITYRFQGKKELLHSVHEAYASCSKPMLSSTKTPLRLQLLSVPSTEFYVIEARGFVRASANRGHDLLGVQVVRVLIEEHAAKFVRNCKLPTTQVQTANFHSRRRRAQPDIRRIDDFRIISSAMMNCRADMFS